MPCGVAKKKKMLKDLCEKKLNLTGYESGPGQKCLKAIAKSKRKSEIPIFFRKINF